MGAVLRARAASFDADDEDAEGADEMAGGTPNGPTHSGYDMED